MQNQINLMDDTACWVDSYPRTNSICIADADAVIEISREQAIAAARAILKHFQVGVD